MLKLMHSVQIYFKLYQIRNSKVNTVSYIMNIFALNILLNTLYNLNIGLYRDRQFSTPAIPLLTLHVSTFL